MSSNRPLMNVNEDSEILFKLGILTSKAKSKKRLETICNNADDGTFSGSITDDEDSEMDVLYDKQSLLNRESGNNAAKQRQVFSIKKAIPNISFFILVTSITDGLLDKDQRSIEPGLLNVILLISLPELVVLTVGTPLSLLLLVIVNGIGCVIGNCLPRQLFNQCNPLLLLMFCIVGSVPFTLTIAWCEKLYSLYFVSFILGIFLGFIHQGGLIIVAANGVDIRSLLVLHILIGCGSMVAPLTCALFISEPAQLPAKIQQFSIAPLKPHYTSEHGKRLFLRQTTSQAEFFTVPPFIGNNRRHLPLGVNAVTGSSSERDFASDHQFGDSFRNFQLKNVANVFPRIERKRGGNRADDINGLNNSWYLWKGQVSKMNGVKLAYGFVAILSFSCVLFFMLPLFCFCYRDSLFTTENEHKYFGKVQVSRAGASWQWFAGILFFILSGIEGIFSTVLSACASDLFDSSSPQHMGYFTTFAFWAGITVSRVFFFNSPKIAGSMQFMQFSLLVALAVLCFGALFSQNSSVVTLDVEIFLIGIFLSPVIPCVVGWLDAQKTNSWWTLCSQHCIAISIGRTLLTVLTITLLRRVSPQPLTAAAFRQLFVIIGCLVFGALLVLLLLARYVRDVARVIAVEKLSETLMRTDPEDDTAAYAGDNASKRTKDAMTATAQRYNNGYVQLSSNDMNSEELYTGSDREYEDEL